MSRREFIELGALAAGANTVNSGCSLRVPPVTDQTSHRPWQLPNSRWVMFMRWHDLLFLHWPIRPELVRPLIPTTLELDTFDMTFSFRCPKCDYLNEEMLAKDLSSGNAECGMCETVFKVEGVDSVKIIATLE